MTDQEKLVERLQSIAILAVQAKSEDPFTLADTLSDLFADAEEAQELSDKIASNAQGHFSVIVDSSEDDPFSVIFTVQGPGASLWADRFGAIDGGTWEEADGKDFVYDHGTLRPGCYDEWRRDGWVLDLSNAPAEDPFDVFYGLEGEALETEMNAYTAIGLHEDEDLKEQIRSKVRQHASADCETA